MEPDIVIWRTLLSSCRIFGNVHLGEQIVNHIGQLKSSDHNGGEVFLSNLVASLGIWERVTETRKLMVDMGSESSPGYSWIEVNGLVHEFLVADQFHPQIVEIRNKLSEILRRLRPCLVKLITGSCHYLDRLTFGVSMARCKPAKQKGGSMAVCRLPLQ